MKSNKETKDKEAKILFIEKTNCPWCGKKTLLRKTRVCIQPGIAAKYKDTISVEKDTQTVLG